MVSLVVVATILVALLVANFFTTAVAAGIAGVVGLLGVGLLFRSRGTGMEGFLYIIPGIIFLIFAGSLAVMTAVLAWPDLSVNIDLSWLPRND